MKKTIMILLSLAFIPLLAGCEDKSVCDNGLCFWYEYNISKTDTTIEQNTNAKYRYTINDSTARSYKTITYEDGAELGTSACASIPVATEANPTAYSISKDLVIKSSDLAIGTEIYARIEIYSDNDCKKSIRSLSSNKLTIIPKSHTIGPYTYSDGTISVCPDSKDCIKELSAAGYTAQTTSSNCHSTAKGYIDGIAKAVGASFSSSNYTKQTYDGLEAILEKIKSEINAGRPVLARVYRPAKDKDSSTTQDSTTHSVTVVAFKNSGTKMSDFLIVDPWRNGNGGALVSGTLNRGPHMGSYDYRFCSMQYSGQKSKCDDTYSIMAYAS